ncbi:MULTISPECIES: helix-turn-helix domain-containing protein [unclassified Sphingomonas]|uniref:helix-turn-helix domain-containing protein n=1 Tax=unclassified Sphingomonas TaxID=196159 RepID=UPI000E71E3FD|nr:MULTISPECIES: helix-turn-helix domain-containing protein [unclassified Sphingomonas]RKE53211.1 hypothetical protein C8J39_0349 [Sphingomonas sp. PP-CC-1A-547]TCM09705.1 hypothetical protein C8J41_101206 [Sphingomonas sp. PP-CC-3G-468]
MQHDDAEETADGSAVVRPQLPDWPRLMPLRLACAYFGVCDRTFRKLGIAPRRIGRRVLWDRHDLDRFADGMAGMPHRSSDPMAGTRAMEKRFFARLKNGQERATGR